MDRMTEEQAAALIVSVDTLGARATLAEEQAEKDRKLRNWLIGAVAGVVILLVLVIIGGVVLFEQVGKINDVAEDAKAAADEAKHAAKVAQAAVDAVEVAQVTICENGNETRGLQHDFWTYLVTVSAQSPGNQNTVVQEFFADFQHTIDVAFAQRDCTDLTKRYPAPEFPDIPTQKEIKAGRQ